MIGRTHTVGLTLLVAGALVFVTPGPSQTAPPGIGFRPGGIHPGGFHPAAHGVSLRPAGQGVGFRPGGIHPGGFHPAGQGSGGYHYRPSYEGYHHYRPYSWGSYGYYPYSYYSSPYYEYPYDYSGYSWTYDPGYSSPYYQAAPYYHDGSTRGGSTPGGYQSSAAPAAPALVGAVARLIVTVPADAMVWIEDRPTTLTGSVREFTSPPLAVGSWYAYVVRARWYDLGREVTQTQEVALAAGSNVVVRFPLPPGSAGQARP